MNEGEPLVLAAEDLQSDAQILQIAFKRAKVPARLTIVSDGDEVVKYLTGGGEYADRVVHPLPKVILLDLKMPRMHGFDVLEWLRKEAEFRDIPAIVLTSSSDDSDVRKARELGARDFFVKPLMLGELMEIVRTICGRWL